MAPAWVWARGGVEIITSDSGGFHAEVVQGLEEGCKALGLSAQVTTRADSGNGLPLLVVCLGTRALRDAAARADRSPAWAAVPVLSALLPQAAWRAGATGLPKGSSAVWLDQPVDRFVELVRQAFPGRRRLGVLFGPTSLAQEPTVERAAAQRGLGMVKATVQQPDTELFPALQRVLQGCDILLAIPDPVLYNADSLQNILIATYRQRVPMVSYTAAHVRAGATLALHTPVQEVVAQVVRALRQFAAQGTLPAAEDSDGFSVALNEQVARSLGLDLRGAAELEKAVRRAEGRSS